MAVDPRDGFDWAVGVEDTFIPQPAPSGRVLDEYELIGHYRAWRDDVALIASTGVRMIRYGLPWYRVNPAPGRFDWSWTDRVMDELHRLQIEPIVDLVHYGAPEWLTGSFLDPAYPQRVAEYAFAVATRYAPVTHHYTPLNEPAVHASFAGRTGLWPPHRRGERGYVAVLTALARGIVATIGAVRAADPEGVIVQVEATEALCERGTPGLVPESLARQYLPLDLVLGRVGPDHPLAAHLRTLGVDDSTFADLTTAPPSVDVVGLNFYPHLSCYELVDGRRRRRYGDGSDLEAVLTAYHRRYELPVMVTETSDTSARPARRLRWLEEAVRGVRSSRAAGVPVTGFTWWPVFSLVDWRYRRGHLPLETYWRHMGLWDLRAGRDGGVPRRESTPLVDAFRAYVAAGSEPVGPLAGQPRMPTEAMPPISRF